MKGLAKLICLALLLYFAISDLQSQPKLWGTMPLGGSTEAGTIFQYNTDGSQLDIIYDFKKYNCSRPRTHAILADNSLFYGIASGGFGSFGSVIYEFDPFTNEFNIAHDFFDPVTHQNYSADEGFLLQASNGKLYGVTQHGGTSGDGQLFEFDIYTRECQYKVEFEAATKGEVPVGGLFEASDGRLYGVTYEGGTNGLGVLYVYDPSINMFAVLKHFNGLGNGAHPYGGVVQAANGILYGLTINGGTQDEGVLFQYDIGSNSLSKLHDFNGSVDGANPEGIVLQASDGHLYGLMSAGGPSGKGGIFMYDISQDLFVKKMDFNGSNGDSPHGSLIEYESSLWGMTSYGGVNNKGVLFRYDPSGDQYFKLLDFYGEDYGESPTGSLTLGPDGTLFGQTNMGGAYSTSGIMFEYFPATNIFEKRFNFREAPLGSQPYSSPIYGNDGMIYGTAYVDGENTTGVVYRIDPSTWEFEGVYHFGNWINTGGGPQAGLMLASNGMMYGLAMGGTYADGVLYLFNPNTEDVTVLYSFDDQVTSHTSNTFTNVVEASNGKIYGVTYLGGLSEDGILFEYDLATSTFSKIHDFQENLTGENPSSTPIQAANGKIYGVTEKGGQFDMGVIYEFDPITSVMSVVINFDGTNKGFYPIGTLLEYEDNILYGITQAGGADGEGVLYMFDAESGIFSKKVNFSGSTSGSFSQSSLMLASDGLIYGSTQMGGLNDFGGVFSYDPGTNIMTNLYSFSSYADRPRYGALLEVDSDYGVDEVSGFTLDLNIFPNPAKGDFTLQCTGVQAAVQITITDIQGRIVYSESTENQKENTICAHTMRSLN